MNNNNPLTNTQKKLRRIGIIGKWICNVGLVITFLSSLILILLVLSSKSNGFSNHRVGKMTIYFISPDKNLSSSVKPEANRAIDQFINQPNLTTYQSHVISYFFYAVATGFFIYLIRKICVEFSQSNIFTFKNARHFNLIGWLFLFWYLAAIVEQLFFSTHHLFSTTGMEANLFSSEIKEPWLYFFAAESLTGYIPVNPLILPLALVFLAFGWSIKQSIALQEEQSLTI